MVLHGLAYLHARAILHRDIKGANVLVDAGGVCKLADFGASKLVELSGGSVGGGDSVASPGALNYSLKGTPYWMAPEVIKQVGHGKPADLWSVGCTAVEMLTARPPWSHFNNQIAALFHIAQSTAP